MQSMTGFGKAQSNYTNKKISVEIRSLNSKQLDLSMRMHSVYRAKELELRTELAKQLERGKVDIAIYTEGISSESTVSINKNVALAYYKELQKLSLEIGVEANHLLPLVLKMPDVLKAEKEILTIIRSKL